MKNTMKTKQESNTGSDAPTCSPSLTPETDDFILKHTAIRLDSSLGKRMRQMEIDRNHWRAEHDRVVREYQHRLMTLATAAIGATNYPENATAQATTPAPTNDDHGNKQ